MKSNRWLFVAGVCLVGATACSEDTETATTAATTGNGGSAGDGGAGAATTSNGGSGATTSVGGSGGQGGQGGSVTPTIEAPELVSGTGCGSVSDATLTWVDNSSDEEGFRVERSDVGANTFTLIASVAPDVTTYTDTTATGGSFEYRVVAYNDEAEAASNVRAVHLGLPTQTATLEINPTTLAVTVTVQPSHFTLAAPNLATWAGVGNPMTVSVDVENSGVNRLVFNPKAVITSVSDNGTVTGDGTFAASPYVYYGPEALEIGATATRDIVINNLTATTNPITVELRLENHAMLFGGSSPTTANIDAVDAGGTGEHAIIDAQQFGNAASGGSSGTGSGLTYAVASPDGRFVYFGNRHQPTLVVLDTVTMSVMTSGDLTGANNLKFDSSGTGSRGAVRGVTMSPDGTYLYVTMATQTSMYEAGSSSAIAVDGSDNPIGTFEVIRLDRATLQIVDQLTLMTGVAGAHIGRVQLTPDGKRGVVRLRHYTETESYTPNETHGRFFLLDMETMSIIDGDPAVGDQQAAFDLSGIGWYVGGVAPSADGNTIFVAAGPSNSDFALYSVDVATADATLMTPPTAPSTDMLELVTGPDGRVYWGTGAGTKIYDPSTQTWLELAETVATRSFAFSGASCTYYRLNTTTPRLIGYDISDDAVLPSPATSAGDLTPGSFSRGHSFVVTPF